MEPTRFRFDRFHLDPEERRLLRDGEPVAVNGRYLDALTLLVAAEGRLVSKDRFIDEVWRGAAVTDEALTQCIKTLRRQLGDDARRPRFIETAPKHGYRFIAAVERVGPEQVSTGAAAPRQSPDWSRRALAAGASGAGAGVFGGLFYGLAVAASTGAPLGASSAMLLVLACVAGLLGAAGGGALGLGVAAVERTMAGPSAWSVAGGAAGGLMIGGVAKVLGLAAFAGLFGRSPGDMTGGLEGALLGAAVGLGAWLGGEARWRAAATAAASGAVAGVLISRVNGRLLGGSLDLLAQSFPGSRLRLDALAALVGEARFGPLTGMTTAAFEALVFCGCVAAALVHAPRR